MEKPIVLYTDHPINKRISNYFSIGVKTNMCHVKNFVHFDRSIAVYGYLRGTGEAIHKSNNYWYIDHGYFKQSSRVFKNNIAQINKYDGYFRIVHNNFWHNGIGNFPNDRLNKLNLKFKSQRKKGEYIILSEPTNDAKRYYKLDNWLSKTIDIISKFSDRKIIVHNRDSKTSLLDLLPNAWAFVSDHSSAGFLAMVEGVPAFFTNYTLKNIASIENIENGNINYEIFKNLAYGQWKIEEIYDGSAWDFLSKDLLT